MDNIAGKIIDLKEKIEEAKNQKAQYEGKLSSLMQTLEDNFECSSIEEIKESIQTMQENSEKIEKSLKRKMEKFMEKYNL
jgi:predicted  nucleic acid-binding Zn-ribbon protein